jgi:molybdenum cofactor synthesis domain-containing protein
VADPRPRGIRAAVLTVSDGVAAGRRPDASGPALAAEVERAFPGAQIDRAVEADDPVSVASRIRAWCDAGFDLVLATGGTGVAPRDRTPEAVRTLIEFEVPGLAEKMRAETGAAFPAAYLSRGMAGVRGATLIAALPGSPRGAVDCFRAFEALLPHAIALLRGEGAGHQVHPGGRVS